MADLSKPVIVADATKGTKVDAAVISKPFRDEIKAKVAAMKKAGIGRLGLTEGRRFMIIFH
jgi:hypothetical protein